MTPAEAAIREALAAGPTFWKCKACGSTSEVSGAIVGDNWCNSCGACDTMEGFPACNPAALAELLAEMDRLRAERKRSYDAGFVEASRLNRREINRLRDDLTREQNRSQMFADLVRGVAVVLHGPGYSDTSKLPAEVEALKADAGRWRSLYRRAVNVANGLTNYVEERPELRRAERELTSIETEARAAIDAAKGGGNG